MKKLLLVLLAFPFVGLNAQIFINTNPNASGSSSTIVKENKVVDDTKKELQTTKTEVEEVKTTVSSPNLKTNTTTGTTTITTTSTPVTTTTKTVSTPVTTVAPVVNTNVSGTTVSGTSKSTSTNTSATTGNSSYNDVRTSSSVMTSTSEDVPPNAQPGKCYARCQTEDQYAFNTKEVVNTPKMIKKIQLPALYTTVYDTVIVKPQTIRYENIPAQYETVREQKMVAPATTKWVKGKADAGCLSANPDDCQVMCLVEVPAQYTTVSKSILKSEAWKKEIITPMEYKIVSKQVKTQNERYVEQEIPATYKTVQERVLVKKGGYQEWREVLCGSDLNEAKITAIQMALKAAGFDPGPIDNIFGSQTKEALIAYQRAKGLPVGNLNIETLKSLGVN